MSGSFKDRFIIILFVGSGLVGATLLWVQWYITQAPPRFHLVGELVVPKYVELNLWDGFPGGDPKEMAFFDLSTVLGSGCGGGVPLQTQVQRQEDSVIIDILGHEPTQVYGMCAAIISSNANVSVYEDWFATKKEIAVDFLMSGKHNRYRLRLVEEELVELYLDPVEVTNVISNRAGYNPSLQATTVSIYINLGEYNRQQYEKAIESGDWNFCMEIRDNKYQRSDCIEEIAVKLNDKSICAHDPDSSYQNLCYSNFFETVNDPDGCNEFYDTSRLECYRGLSIRLQNPDICFNISYREGIDWCLIHYVMRYKDKSVCEKVVDEPNDVQNKELCLWHAR